MFPTSTITLWLLCTPAPFPLTVAGISTRSLAHPQPHAYSLLFLPFPAVNTGCRLLVAKHTTQSTAFHLHIPPPHPLRPCLSKLNIILQLYLPKTPFEGTSSSKISNVTYCLVMTASALGTGLTSLRGNFLQTSVWDCAAVIEYHKLGDFRYLFLTTVKTMKSKNQGTGISLAVRWGRIFWRWVLCAHRTEVRSAML